MYPMGTRAAIYCRISDDREGAGLGVARQEADCRELCERRGWSVVELYVDNDTSAYSGKPRPAYRRLLDEVAAGAVDVVVAWHTDRLHRSPRELEEFLDVLERRSVTVETVKAGLLDFATPAGRMVARQLGAVARYESEHKADRSRRKALELAEAGRVSGGGSRPYGYSADRMTIVPEEAAIIRECARRVLAGEPVRTLARDLNERGVPTSAGKQWSAQTLRRMLASGRISAQREHQPRGRGETTRKIVGDIVGDAVWPAIIDKADTARLRSILLDPARRLTSPTPRRCLLSGILVCGRCGAPLVGRPRDGGDMRYVCNKVPGNSRCGRTYVLSEPADELIVGAVFEALSTADLLAAVRERGDDGDAAVVTELERDEAALVQLGQDLDDGLVTRAEWLARRGRIEARIAEARRQLNRRSGTAALDGLAGRPRELLEAEWQGMTLARRRAVLSALIERVVVQPGVRGRNLFDPARFEVAWRG